MKMKYSWIVFGVALLAGPCLSSCSKTPRPVSSISESTESILEPDYEMQYPANWKISGQEDKTKRHLTTVTYKIRHPKNKDCLLAIDIMRYSDEGKLSPERTKEIITTKVRQFQKIFESAGYRNISFRNFAITYNKNPAIRLIVTGHKSEITRTIEAIIITYHGSFYIAYYQWFSPWGAEVRSRLKELVETFRIKY